MRGICLVLALVSLMLLFGCPGRTETPTPGQEGPEITVISAGTGGSTGGTTPAATDEEWAQKALSEQDAYLCLRVSIEKQDACILPLSNLSLQNCMMLSDYAYEKECLWHHAQAQQDMTICDLMQGSDVRECIQSMAPPCTFEADNVSKGRCMAFLNNDYNYCRDDSCFFDFGTQNRNASACAGIQDVVRKAACEGVISQENPCNQFESSNRDLCYYMMALGKNSSHDCYNIDSEKNSQIAYQCFEHFALVGNNKDICSGLGLLMRWDCYKSYSIQKQDISACEAIDPRAEANWNQCFDEFARAFFQASACNQIKAGVAQTNCYAYVVMAATHLEMWDCNNVAEKEWKDRCFTSMADLDNDATYCNYVEDVAIKEICLSKV
ncbi:MAG: hypothetical protein NTY83_00880 [Candidatus Micrarchaeota archaeon]|nr:hypothetical protein [Candidatus Micrarchaeota archaeon]